MPNQKANFRNRALTDTFEPGSTIKPFSIATALGSGHFKPDTVINTSPGWLKIGRHTLHDEHHIGQLTVTEVLQYSSNIGVSKMVLSLPPNRVPDLLHKLGFGVKRQA